MSQVTRHFFHSARKATMGSTRVARRAGNHAAKNATTETSSTMAANVNGSDAPTPKRTLFNKRVAAEAPDTPITRLIATIARAGPTTRRKIEVFPAPRALRIGLSAVRGETEQACTPYIP